MESFFMAISLSCHRKIVTGGRLSRKSLREWNERDLGAAP